MLHSPFAYGAFTLSGRSFQDRSARIALAMPQSEPHGARTMVWALPRSLAATYGIVITFSSSGYLDVSVRRVPSILLWIQSMVPVFLRRVSPFRYLRITACLRLPEAFRSLPRLSSAPSARASALRSCSLNHGCFRISPFLRYPVHSVTPSCISLYFSDIRGSLRFSLFRL